MKIFVHKFFSTQEAATAALTQQHQAGNVVAQIKHLPSYIFPDRPATRWVVSHIIEEAA